MFFSKVYSQSGATIKLVDKFDEATKREWKLTSYAKSQNIPTVAPDISLHFLKDSDGNGCNASFKDSCLSLKNDALLNF